MQEILIFSIGGILVGSLSIWFYYRNKFKEVLTELEDKKVIIKTIHQHSDEIERLNVKQFAKEHNEKVASSKVKKTPKAVKNAKSTKSTKSTKKNEK